jgi:hypothetical protein
MKEIANAIAHIREAESYLNDAEPKLDQLADMLELVKKYRARLEIDHHFELKDGKMIRIDDPIGIDVVPDKIACLEAEIALLREDIEDHKERQP